MYKSECEHHFPIPHYAMCCGYYRKTVDAQGNPFIHYTFCKEENCPIAHPELLKGRKLESEIESRAKLKGLISHNKRDDKRCYFCGTNMSVKYIVEVDMPYKAVEPFKVYACNICATVKVR